MSPGHPEAETHRRRLRVQTGTEGEWREAHQVHGVRILGADDSTGAEGDGWVIDRPGRFAAVRTADCVPLLLVREVEGRVVRTGAIHCGWRGTVAGIVRRAVDAMGGPDGVWGALGPAVGRDHFEVGPEVITAARDSLGGQEPPFVVGPRGRPHLDLWELVRRHLVDEGVTEDRVDVLGRCTYAEADHFFSYRRDGAATGHQLSVIGWVD
jgi:hypothetical protein